MTEFNGLQRLTDFVRESNLIEGILRDPTPDEIKAHEHFLALNEPRVSDLVNLVAVLQPGARLRDNMSVPCVRVGNHIAPASGPEIREQLEYLLKRASNNWLAMIEQEPHWIWDIHNQYETLHPFTDGNGRSGRALWLWCHGGMAPLGFLHSFYYETLAAYR